MTTTQDSAVDPGCAFVAPRLLTLGDIITWELNLVGIGSAKTVTDIVASLLFLFPTEA